MFHSDISVSNGHVEIEWRCAENAVTTQDPWTSVETTTSTSTETTTSTTTTTTSTTWTTSTSSTYGSTTTLSTSAFVTEGRDDEYYEYLDQQNGEFDTAFYTPATCNMLEDVDDFVTHVKERIRAALRSDIFTYSRKSSKLSAHFLAKII